MAMPEIKLSHTRKFSELKHGDWFIDEYGRVGIKVVTYLSNKQQAHYFNYGCIQWMSGGEKIQQLENIFVTYEYAQKVTKKVVVTQEVDENKKGHLSFNEVSF